MNRVVVDSRTDTSNVCLFIYGASGKLDLSAATETYPKVLPEIYNGLKEEAGWENLCDCNSQQQSTYLYRLLDWYVPIISVRIIKKSWISV